jgi:putative hydrolase of the HAD superfamily
MRHKLKYIFFDCMETIVDLHELPSENDYAFWSFSGSGVEGYWADFNDFLLKYMDSKRELNNRMKLNQEYEWIKRLEGVVEKTETIPSSSKHQAAKQLYDHFWHTYKSKCFIKEEVLAVLSVLAKHYKLAVVSNFMIQDGIEELLQLNQADRFFDFVITSINSGWRKPSPLIYQTALQHAGCQPEEILFVGDDYENDYVLPGRVGMNVIFLEKNYKNTDQGAGVDKINNFSQLNDILLGN